MVLLGQLGTLGQAVACIRNPEGSCVSSLSLAQTWGLAVSPPCQCLVRVPFPDAGKQVHLWSGSAAGCYFSVPGRAWPWPVLALGVVAAT